MFTKITRQFLNPSNSKLLSNFISLSALQVIGYIIPLFVIPYLIIVLGIDKFGLVTLAQAVMSYFIIFTDYGFNLTATRNISLNTSNQQKISEIFNAVFSTKIVLGIICIIVLVILLVSAPIFSNEYHLFFYSFSLVIGQLLFPLWFFQGIEKMKYITYLTLFSKFVFTGLVFVLIKEPSDYIYVNFLNGIGNIISSVISIWFIKSKFNIPFKFSSAKKIKSEIIGGWHVMLSSFSINIYINSSIIILDFFTTPIILGYYSIAEKIMMSIRQLLSVFSQVLYPHICKLTITGHKELKKFFLKIFVPFFILILICYVILFVFSKNIIALFTNNNDTSISTLVRLLCIAPIIVCLNIPAYQTLLAYNLKNSYSLIMTTGALLCVILNIILAYNYQAIGTAIAILITETFITLGLYIVLEYKHKEISLFT